MTLSEQIARAVQDSLQNILTARISSMVEDEVTTQIENICIEDYIHVDEIVGEALDNAGI